MLSLLLLVVPWHAHAEEEWQWLYLQDQQLWLMKPPHWSYREQSEQGLVTLELEDLQRRSGVMVWGGALGLELPWQQLAKVWQKNTAGLENLQELQAESSLKTRNSGIEGVDIHFQEYAGQVAGQPARTWVGYLSHAERSFVLMGIFPQQDPLAQEQVRRVIGSIRLAEPEDWLDADQVQASSELSDEAVSPEQSSAEQAEAHIPPAPVELQPFAELRLYWDDEGKRPIEGSVARDITRLVCLAQINRLEPDALLRAEWYYLDGGNGEPFVVDEQRYRGEDESLRFVLHRPDNTLFPSGNYRLLLMAGEAVASVDFYLRDPSEQELVEQAKAGQAEGQFGLYAYLEMERLQQVSEAEAVEWLRKAAHQGLAIAQYHLGRVYFEGLHQVPEDKVAAMDWFRRAALQDHADAAYYMARGYREGLGVPRNLAEAVAWTRRAANLGNAQSQYNLALHHLLGRGLRADSAAAMKWLRQALAAGYTPAQEVLTWLEVELRQQD